MRPLTCAPTGLKYLRDEEVRTAMKESVQHRGGPEEDNVPALISSVHIAEDLLDEELRSAVRVGGALQGGALLHRQRIGLEGVMSGAEMGRCEHTSP